MESSTPRAVGSGVPAPPSLGDLPAFLEQSGSQQDGVAFTTAACLLCPVTWRGVPAMVKVTGEPEELRGIDALAAWAGRGAVRILHRAGDVTIMERAGATLRASEPDDGVRTATLTAALRALHQVPSRGSAGFTPLSRHLRSLLDDTAPRFDPARRLARELLQRNEDAVLLHGDVHAENLLSAADGWVFIDPKGVIGPRVFDFANIFTNWTLPEALEHFDARLAIVCRGAAIDERTMLHWIVVWSAVSGIWHLEDGDQQAAVFPHTIMDRALRRLRRPPQRRLPDGVVGSPVPPGPP